MPILKVNCPTCRATGLRHGPYEIGDCAVICPDCKGTGCTELSYEPFTKRRAARHIKWVFRAVSGVTHNLDKLRLSPKVAPSGGVPYAAWLKGAEPQPARILYCPLQWTDGDIEDGDHPARQLWEEQCSEFHNISDEEGEICPNRDKPWRLSICWRRFFELTEKEEK